MAHTITSSVAGTPGTGYFLIDGNFTSLFVPGSAGVIQSTVIMVSGSAGNNGQYVVSSSIYESANDKTRINVTSDIPSSTVSSGSIEIIYTPSYKIDFSDPAYKPSIYIQPLTINGPTFYVEGTTETSIPVNPTPSTTLDLPGRGTLNYGELLLQNTVRMTEHFSSGNPPVAPTVGQLWYDTGVKALKLRTLDTTDVPTWTPVLSGVLSIRGFTFDVSELTPQSTWVIQHNLASRNVNVQTYVYNGSSLELTLPYSVVVTDLNTVTVQFSTPKYGKAVIICNTDDSSIPPPPTGVLTAGNGLQMNTSVLSLRASSAFNLASGTLDLALMTGLNPGTYNSVSINSYGLVTGASNVDTAAGVYMPIAGGTFSNNVFAPAFRARKGLPSGDNATVGYAFGIDGDTGLFANGTVASAIDTTQLAVYFNSVKTVTFNSNGNLDLNVGILQKISGTGTSRIMQEDGLGRQHWYWNTTGGTSPVFENGSEDATDLMHTSNSGNPAFAFKAASGVGKAAGAAINWTNVLYADLTGTFQYKGNAVYHAGNLTNVSQLTNNMNYVQSSVIPTFTGGAGGVEGGQIQLAKPTTTSLLADIAVDIYSNRIRFFEAGGTSRGAFIDFTECAATTGTNLLAPDWSKIANKPTTLSGYGISASDSILSGSYLPLTGGTLTGLLNTTDITSSGTITVSTSGAPSIILEDTNGLTAWLYNDSSVLYFLKGTSAASSATVLPTGVHPLSINLVNGSTSIGGNLTVYGNVTLTTGKSFYTDNWFRSSGNTGWYNETYGGGIHMSDTTYVRTYNSRHLYVSANAANAAAITGITGASVNTHAILGQPGVAGQGGICGMSQNGAMYGILGYNNAYALYGAGAIYVTGDITGLSDERKKTNIETISGALEIVDKLRGVRFNWKDTGKKSAGVIAQDVKAVLPELVHENPDGDLSVAYGNLTGVLIEAVKELSGKLNQALTRIAELEAKV